MNYLLSEVFFWIINKLIIFVFILALLVGLYSVHSEYERYRDDEKNKVALIEKIKEEEARLVILEKEIDEITKQKLKVIRIRERGARNDLQQKKYLLRELDDSIFSPTQIELRMKLEAEIIALKSCCKDTESTRIILTQTLIRH